MTRDEARGNLIHAIRWNDIPKKEALEIAIKALEQQTCEDAVSREAVLDVIDDIDKTVCMNEYHVIVDAIDKLPSVNPQPKIGHWRAVYQGDEIINYRCSECELGDTNGSTNLYGWDYCRSCGAKMVEPQERSEE